MRKSKRKTRREGESTYQAYKRTRKAIDKHVFGVQPLLKTSDSGRRFIEAWEGLYLHTYDDGTGTLTIGYGHTSAAGPPRVYRGMRITAEEADRILAADLHAVENEVNRVVKVPLNQHQFDAMVSFDFNTGALGRSNVLRSVNAGRFAEVPGDLNHWVHGGGRVMQGLVRRRHAEAILFNTGQVIGP